MQQRRNEQFLTEAQDREEFGLANSSKQLMSRDTTLLAQEAQAAAYGQGAGEAARASVDASACAESAGVCGADRDNSLATKVKALLAKCCGVKPTLLSALCASVVSAASAPAYASAAMPHLNHAQNAVVNQTSHDVGTVMQITGNGNNALLVWDSFNVGKGNAVHFNTITGKGASFLNIVKGAGASHIDGNIIDNTGKSNMYLINPNGINVGRTGSIEHFKSVYLGTAKPSQEVIDRFKNADIQPIAKDVLPQNRALVARDPGFSS